MNKDFFEYLYNLRASGFSYTIDEDVRKLAFYAVRDDKPLAHMSVQGGDFKMPAVGGDIGTLSAQEIVNCRYMLVALAVSMKQMADDSYIDRQISFALCDYYIQKADSIHRLHDFEELSGKMMEDFHALYSSSPWKSYGRLLDLCIDFIRNRLYSPLSAQDVAEHVGYSASYLRTLFRKETGMTLYSFIQRSKIHESQKALLCTSQPVSTIASALGYHSVSHFSKAFKQAVGVSPLQYRQMDAVQRSRHLLIRIH